MSKVVIITGASSGIGAATARELAKRGWSVVINYSKSASEAAEVAASCKDALMFQADVSEDTECTKLVAATLEKWGKIDALVNNAGTTKFVDHANLDGLTADDFLRIYRTNVVGPFQMVRACVPSLKASRGAIVNVSSVASQLGIGSSVAYAASKAALNAMTYSLARSLGPEVRVNAVCPGWVDTPWHANAYDAERVKRLSRHYASLVPLKDYARPEDVADCIVWLIEGARHVTGEAIFVDGGLHISPPG
jgi:3-oxoacyl-[acyl-carrier protein] reductase